MTSIRSAPNHLIAEGGRGGVGGAHFLEPIKISNSDKNASFCGCDWVIEIFKKGRIGIQQHEET